jgi:uncharacterized protein YqeY
MTIEILQKEMISALKAGNKFRKETISTLIAQIKKAAIDKGCRDNIPESLVDEELLKAKKAQEDSINLCPNARRDLYDEYVAQMRIIKEFAPSLIEDEGEIRNIILDCGFEVSKQNQGMIMKTIKASYAGKVDMKKVSQVFKEMVS